ncbi:S-layer homology domain-containing protein [Paenibacillus sp. JNUCC31]|uniref:S-layer homology domain-containing protein n=1 Tax=Paenibacillus sp. JNUCC-31 TaxID=2777983 RepID=UPI00177A859C|nr:S-layer homology domain-containing protein [Paenibacillus sp. JNUCC-31]QOS80508.1 S-layer homology domain-containing protein [Paenibacillus sp. JNUCC-31]
MNPTTRKIATFLTITALGTAVFPLTANQVHAATYVKNIAATTTQLTSQQIAAAIKELNSLRIMNGYADQSMGEHKAISRAELASLVYKTFNLESKTGESVELTDVNPNAWYAPYASKLVELGIMQANNGEFNPQGQVSDAELEQAVSKAMQRDVKSVHHWMSTFYSENGSATRGETAVLLQTAHKAIPSEQAQIQSVRSLNAITLIVTFDKPLTAADEVFAKTKTDFVLSSGLTLTNMPRLKTGSIATYIVPTSVQKAGEVYSLTYKGQDAGSFEGSGTKLNMTTVRQVTNDTFEIEALQANGVVDYGYIISAYSGGRGANAFVMNDQEQADGKTFQIISSMQARQVVITPEGGEPIVAKYVPFTQSTDGKQEPKFRLPEGQTMQSGVTYTVSSDWANINNASFTARSFDALKVASAQAVSETSIEVTLAQDPGDELFSGRSVTLTSPSGDVLTATYKYSSRKGATGVFDLVNDGKLNPGTTYTISPVGDWSVASSVTVTL